MLALLLTLTATLAAAPAAGAALLSTDRRCYQERQDVVLDGTVFAPMSPIAIMQNARPFGTAETDAAGSFRRKFSAPRLRRDVREKVFTLTGTDGAANSAAVRYRTTKIIAAFKPRSGDPRTLKVRFSINGFALLRRRAPVYLHYVSPSGRLRRDVRLGTARGTCGKIRRTRLRHLFPFTAERGRWVLQFDTNRTYRRATSRSNYIWVRKPVEIFRK